jgi:hypothetical protein
VGRYHYDAWPVRRSDIRDSGPVGARPRRHGSKVGKITGIWCDHGFLIDFWDPEEVLRHIPHPLPKSQGGHVVGKKLVFSLGDEDVVRQTDRPRRAFHLRYECRTSTRPTMQPPSCRDCIEVCRASSWFFSRHSSSCSILYKHKMQEPITAFGHHHHARLHSDRRCNGCKSDQTLGVFVVVLYFWCLFHDLLTNTTST